jgi:acetolactate decarboxylase
MMHDGKTTETVNLDSLLPNDKVYAVGAISELRGEITVIAGTAYLSYPDGPTDVRTDTTLSPEEGATLLVATEITDWHPAETVTNITWEELDQRIGYLAASVGVDPDKPFAFLVHGQLLDIRWHVINGSQLEDGGGSHEEHSSASIQLTEDEARATLIGFYSPDHQGVFTHMGSKTHIHCVIEDPLSSGHVESVVLPAGTIITFSANLTEVM